MALQIYFIYIYIYIYTYGKQTFEAERVLQQKKEEAFLIQNVFHPINEESLSLTATLSLCFLFCEFDRYWIWSVSTDESL